MSKLAIQNGKSIPLPDEFSTLAEMLYSVALNYPEKGMYFIDSARQETFISYPVLIEKAQYCLTELRKKQLATHDFVIIEITDPQQFYIVFWACIIGGIVAVPITQPKSFDPNSKKMTKLFNVWEQLEKPTIITDLKSLPYYQKLQNSPLYTNLKVMAVDLKEIETDYSSHTSTSESLAVLQFSSGSTGMPKGVQLTHKNILVNLISMKESFQVTDKDVTVSWLPHTHDMGLFTIYLTSVLCGMNIIIMSPASFIRSPALFLEKIAAHRATWFGSPNFGFEWLTNKIPCESLPTIDLSSIRFCLNGAEPISYEVVKAFCVKFSACGFKEEMMRPAYGMAEATVGVSVHPLGEKPVCLQVNRLKIIQQGIAEFSTDENCSKFYSVGKNVGDLSVRIADKQGNTLDENFLGEIQIQGESVTAGYYGYCNDSLFDGSWLHTGDLGFINDGLLVVTGRIKDVVFVRGQNYFAHDLEEILYFNLKFPRGKLAISGTTNQDRFEEEIIVFYAHKSELQLFLPIKQLIVQTINKTLGLTVSHVIPVKEIPRTTSGKIQRFQLKQQYESGEYAEILQRIKQLCEQESKIFSAMESYEKSPLLKQMITQIWARILNLDLQNIAADEEFFALGGDSVKAFQFLSELESQLGKPIDFRLLIECKTINQIIVYLNKNLSIESLESENESLTPASLSDDYAIAITGFALRLPGSDTPQQFWENLCNSKHLVTPVSEKRKKLADCYDWNDWLGELDNVDYFDHDFFDFSKEEACFIDPQQRLALEVSYEALEEAGCIPGSGLKQNVGVYAGGSANTYYQLLMRHIQKFESTSLHPHALVGNLASMIPAQIARAFHFTGPVLAIDTSCSSSLVALHYAVQALREKQIDGAVVLGTNLLLSPEVHILCNKAGILSNSPYAKVFDKDADGTVLGEGIVVLYLETLAKAKQESKPIHGIIRGTAINNNGGSLSLMAPNPGAQHDVIINAYRNACISPKDIQYIEVHGTGTAIGDPIEINMLSKVFKPSNFEQKVVIGSLKSNIGHLLAAAGIAGLAKVLMCLKHKKFVPSLHLETINPALNLESSPFCIHQKIEEWQAPEQGPRTAGLSSFGFSGTNTHVVLEESPKIEKEAEPQTLVFPHILTLSAKSSVSLTNLIDQMHNLLQTPYLNIYDICLTRNCYRAHFNSRAAWLIFEDRTIQQFSMTAKKNLVAIQPKVKLLVDERNQDLMNKDYWRILFANLGQHIPLGFIKIKPDEISEALSQLDNHNNENILIYLNDNFEQRCPYEHNQINLNLSASLKHDLRTQLLIILAELYLLGVKIDWTPLYQNGVGQLVSLPKYPFESKPLWLDL
ncbi:MAG: AMP-binding protein [Tatlockia sp.]|nr:AMP-binding protein [Tatlockia sp.]